MDPIITMLEHLIIHAQAELEGTDDTTEVLPVNEMDLWYWSRNREPIKAALRRIASLEETVSCHL